MMYSKAKQKISHCKCQAHNLDNETLHTKTKTGKIDTHTYTGINTHPKKAVLPKAHNITYLLTYKINILIQNNCKEYCNTN